ncbi:MAG TPA: histidine phosphatase family protein [Thermoplasmata archaeon]|nr:histidine phosphatase family protein [Thermoplasmata archaeon]
MARRPSRPRRPRRGRSVRPVRIVVLRHGPAETRDPVRWPDDRRRPLSAKGLAQTRRVVRGLAGLIGPVRQVASSPALRARRTAELLARSLGRPAALELWIELDVDGSAEPILARARRVAGPRATIVLVGHEPSLSELVGLAVTGEGASIVRLSKGGAACLEFPVALRPGAGRLRWLLTRKQLAARGAAR